LLQLLGVSQFIDAEKNRSFILSTQQDYTGGFSKWSDTIADPLHTYFGKPRKKFGINRQLKICLSGLCGLSLMNEPGLKDLDYALNMSVAAADHLKEIHKQNS
jgi:geranylgeranyl transferase type-1 subunit beta